ncbi:MAG: 3'(2'),5'-bisphosphate nucleotidase CysQ [Gammaproteobacteria bacterium]|nr:3'(2'),5'-bisphosphate nucleotidase CysQ [Gammaproteobacteria bacterium]MCY4282061.1 3'(2'),5'-bisphosphate nucleotidase CysQ [Gammaproteobacteria bacterium]
MLELARAAADIAKEAAEKIMEVYQTDFEVRKKTDRTPLTRADMSSHDVICSRLTELTPDIPVLSEESAHVPYTTRKRWDEYWLVDPLDGTREFIKRNGEFTVNIALIRHGYPVLGVIYAPVKDLCYYAANSEGAHKQDKGAAAIRLSAKASNPNELVIAGSRSHGNKRQQAFFSSVGDRAETIAIGSSLKFCLVAEGVADIYARFGPTCEWDSAAGQCIVEEAGGRVTDTDFTRLRYNAKESLLNPDFLVFSDPTFEWQRCL